MNRHTQLKLMLLACSILAGVGLLEIAARFLVHADVDGNLYQTAYHLKPYRLPVKMVSGTVERYLSSTNSSLVYDAEMGWLPRASQTYFNTEAIWSKPEEFSTKRTPGLLRIAIFGGSYALGKSHETGWSTVMARSLAQSGITAEVLNFGVPGYGMDQAFLRWRKQGRNYHPHIVIFGFNAGYFSDNLNLVRPFQHPGTEIVFFKPRFELHDAELNLLNVPTPAPDELPGIIADFPNWSLAGKETYFDPADYQPTWYSWSRLAGLLKARWYQDGTRRETAEFYQPGGEAARLGLAILNQFRQEVEDAGGRFCMVHLPSQNHLSAQRIDGQMPFVELLRASDEIAPLIDPTPALMESLKGLRIEDSFRDNHYLEPLHVVIGKALAGELPRRLPLRE